MSRLRAAAGTTGWGLYCACSWTWCIGMFLPVILLGRYGWWGFLAFAIPNVLGCAAFGYILRSRDNALTLVRRHHVAMRLFSLVTISFHIFFLGFALWLLLPGGIAGEPGEHSLWIALCAPVVVLMLGQVLAGIPTRYWPLFAIAVYAISLTAFALIGVQPLREIGWSGEHATIDVLWLTPVMVLGFLLCPYLDLTFHRALQASPSRHAFGVFGVGFAVMIVLTCTYWDVLTTGLTWLVLGHVMAQSIFTISAHLREATMQHGSLTVGERRMSGAVAAGFAPLIGLLIAFFGVLWLDPIAASVDNYLRFLVFYGLIFPAYVLAFMAPGGRTINQRNVVMYSITCLAFAPLYEAGFLHGHAWVLVIPPTVLLLHWMKRRFIGTTVPQLQDGQRTTEAAS